MSEIRIDYYADLRESPALPLVEDYKSEISRRGFGQSSKGVAVSENPWTVVAMDGDKCVGFALHFPYPSVNALWIEASYVDPDYRRRGIHKAMFERVVLQAKIEGCESVQSAAHVNNKESIASMKRQGREVFGLMFTYDVEKD